MMQVQNFDFSVDLLRCILWQYNDAERLQTILAKKQDWYRENQTEFWTRWVRDVFDLRTANDFGLAVWGIILDESREVLLPATKGGKAFGFGRYKKNFTRGTFRRASASYTTLSREQYRLLLQLRYFKLVSRATVPEINFFLKRLFQDQGRVYVLDPCDMTFAVYVFCFSPSSWQQFILRDMDALPRPAGVGTKIRIVNRRAFGFGPNRENYSGTFASTQRRNENG